MALFAVGLTRCALCGQVLDEGDSYVATTHFIADSGHPLYQYSDAIMHRACFLRWERRPAFVEAYNAWTGTKPWGGGRPPPRMRANGSFVGERRRRWMARWDAVLDKLHDLCQRLRG
jgi:hypothetical protein